MEPAMWMCYGQAPLDWSTAPDDELVRALADDPSALEPLYDRYAKLVYGLASAILGNVDEAQDLTQEVFLMFGRGEGTFDAGRGSLGAYLTTLTRSRAIDRLRKRTRSVRLLRRDYESAPAPELPVSPSDEVAFAQCADRVRAALSDLPPNERRAIELAYFQGLSQAEIAEEVGAPLGTVKSWCRRGLMALKTELKDLVE